METEDPPPARIHKNAPQFIRIRGSYEGREGKGGKARKGKQEAEDERGRGKQTRGNRNRGNTEDPPPTRTPRLPAVANLLNQSQLKWRLVEQQ